MDLKDQLKNLFPEHEEKDIKPTEEKSSLWLQDDPIICKYEKRKGKPITILEGYTGATVDFKALAKEFENVRALITVQLLSGLASSTRMISKVRLNWSATSRVFKTVFLTIFSELYTGITIE